MVFYLTHKVHVQSHEAHLTHWEFGAKNTKRARITVSAEIDSTLPEDSWGFVDSLILIIIGSKPSLKDHSIKFYGLLSVLTVIS